MVTCLSPFSIAITAHHRLGALKAIQTLNQLTMALTAVWYLVRVFLLYNTVEGVPWPNKASITERPHWSYPLANSLIQA